MSQSEAKEKTGRPRGSRTRPISQRMGELLARLLLDGLKTENWPILTNPSTGEPILHPKTGEPMRRPPSAAFYREVRQFLAGVGRLAKLEKSAERMNISTLVEEMRREGRLRTPGTDDEESPAPTEGDRPPSWGARR